MSSVAPYAAAFTDSTMDQENLSVWRLALNCLVLFRFSGVFHLLGCFVLVQRS